MASRTLLRTTFAAALAAVSPLTLGFVAASAQASPALLPFVVSNQSGRSEATYVYMIARDASTGAQGYIDSGGTWHAFSFPSSVPAGQPNPAAPDVSIPGPANGASETLEIPENMAGGRTYVSFGQKLYFYLSPGGLVEPAAWTSSDPNHDILFDWTEWARSGVSFDINTTMVDMFSVPMSVSITGTDGTKQTAGQLVSNGRANIFNALTSLGGDWANLVYTRASDGLPLRVNAPVHALDSGAFSSTFFDGYVNDVWTYYASHVLTVNTSVGTFTGTVGGTSFTFKDSSGNVIGSLQTPTTAEVLGCSGAMQPGGQPNETAILAVGARVCAALNRATLSTNTRAGSDTQPTSDASTFYTQPVSNQYSKVMHQNSVDGKAYGFSFDDVAGFSPSIYVADPASAGMTLTPWTGSTTTMSGDPITGPGGKCIDVAGDDTGGDGTPVQIWDCQSYAVDQHWTYTNNTLQTLGKCMDITSGGTADGTKVQLWDCNGTGAQVWQHRSDGSLHNPQSAKCLDDPSGSTSNGTQLKIWDCNGSTAQTWTSAQFGSGGATAGATGAISSAITGKCMDVSGANSANGTSVQLWDCNGSNAQVWTQYSDNTLRALGKCLDATGAGTADGTKLEIWDCNGGANQVWQAYNGGYQNPVSGRCVDDPSSSTTNGTQLQLWDCNGTNAQKWSIPGQPVSGGTTTGGTSATSTIQAEAYTNQSGTQTETCSDTGGGQDVGYISNGDWLEYDNVNFGSNPLSTFSARVASGAASGVSGTVSVVLDNPANAPIGSFAIGNTGGWQTWETVPANITGTTGTHTVYLKFATGSGQDFVNINWLTFS